ncbi:F-box/LRR-repeat protein At3g59200 [Linum perenne]
MKNSNSDFRGFQERLNNLPDSILHHILSFLDTKYVVQTSILLRAWTHVWKHVAALNFLDKSFIQFVDSVLRLRGLLGCDVDKISYVDTSTK